MKWREMKLILTLLFISFLFISSCVTTKEKNSSNKQKYSHEGVYPKSDEILQFDKEADFDLVEFQKNIKYPEKALAGDVEGRVVVRALVDIYGKVVEAFIEESDSELLNDYSLEYVSKAEFSPAMQNGERINSWIYVPIYYRLR